MLTRYPRSSLWLKRQQGACSRRQFLGGALRRRRGGTAVGNHRTCRYDEDAERLTLRTTAMGIPAHIRLPLDLGSRFMDATWNGQPVSARIEKGMDSDFIHIDHRLDGGTLTVQLAPHPQKGKGTTPVVSPENKALS